MASLAQLQQALANPNVRKMLDIIAASEGTTKNGYNTAFGGSFIPNLAAHPNVRREFRQTDGKVNYTTAAGRYQFLGPTWNSLKQRYGFKDFGPQAQDLGAIALIAGRGALNDVMSGNFTSAINKLGREWASLPSSPYAQNKRSWDFVNKAAGGGISPASGPQGAFGRQFVSGNELFKVLPQLAKSQSKPQQAQPARQFVSGDELHKVLPQLAQQSAGGSAGRQFISGNDLLKMLPQLAQGG